MGFASSDAFEEHFWRFLPVAPTAAFRPIPSVPGQTEERVLRVERAPSDWGA